MNRKAERLLLALESAPPGRVVEIGCIREEAESPSEGYSTFYLCRRCLELNLDFRSFDINPLSVKLANEILEKARLPRCVRQGDGKTALRKLGPLSFLYLDSSDDPRDTLEQYHAAELLPRAVIVVDDAQPYLGNRHGKATLLVEWIERKELPFTIHPTEPGFSSLVFTLAAGKKPGE